IRRRESKGNQDVKDLTPRSLHWDAARCRQRHTTGRPSCASPIARLIAKWLDDRLHRPENVETLPKPWVGRNPHAEKIWPNPEATTSFDPSFEAVVPPSLSNGWTSGK